MCVLLGCFQVAVGALVVIAKIPFFFGLTIVLFGKRGKKGGAVEAGRERILDSDPFIEWYQPAGRQPQCSWALPDLWLWENTTARGSREAETALFGLKLAGKSCVAAVKMDIFLSMAQMGVTSAGPEQPKQPAPSGETAILLSLSCSQLMWGSLLHFCTRRNDWCFPRRLTSRQE